MPSAGDQNAQRTASGFPSHVLLLRLWREPTEDGQGAWRASVLNPVSKHRHYFNAPNELQEYLAGLDMNWPEDGGTT